MKVLNQAGNTETWVRVAAVPTMLKPVKSTVLTFFLMLY